MVGGPVHTDHVKDQRLYYTTLKAHIITYLPAAYGCHTSANVLKGFSVRITVRNDCFAATAIADLGPPVSLAEDVDIVLEDEFMETYGEVSALEALELLFDEAELKIENMEADTCD